MIKRHSVAGRIFIGLLVSAVLSVLITITLPAFGYPAFGTFALGTMMMFALMSIMIAFVGHFDRHPLFKFKMHWYLRGPVIGMIFTLMYVLLSYNQIDLLMQSSLVAWMGLYSPFWILIDGAFIGAIMGYLETTFAGEGSELPLQ